MYKVMAIGPLPIEGDVIGGTKVSFESLCRSLEYDKDIDVAIVNTSRPLRNKSVYLRGCYNVITLFKVLFASFLGSLKVLSKAAPIKRPFSKSLV